MSRAAKERIRWPLMLAAALLASLAPAAHASLPRSVDDPALRAAIATEHSAATLADPGYRLLARAPAGYGLLPREPACVSPAPYPETRVRASGFLAGAQRQGTRQLSLDLAVGVCDGPSMYQFAGYDPVNNGDPLGLQTEEKKEEEGCFDSFTAAWGCLTEPFVRLKNTATRWAEHHDQNVGRRRDPSDTGLERVKEQTRLTGELAGDTFDAGMRAADVAGAGGLVTVVYRTATRTVTKQVGKHLVRRLVENGWEVVDDDVAETVARRVPRGTGQLLRVGDLLESVDDALANPQLLRDLNPADLQLRLGGRIPPGWRVETLGRGAHEGQGFVLRQYTPRGNPTGRQIRWHPGGGHHGPDPYWRAIDANTKSDIIPAAPWPR